MKVLLVGDSDGSRALADALASSDLDVSLRPGGSPSDGGFEEIDEIAGDLRDLERELGEGGTDAVLVASDSSAALAAVLVATKLGTPVARIDEAGGSTGATNARLINQLADASLAPEPGAIVDWIRDTYTERA